MPAVVGVLQREMQDIQLWTATGMLSGDCPENGAMGEARRAGRSLVPRLDVKIRVGDSWGSLVAM